MRKPTAVVDLDLTQFRPFPDGLDRYMDAAVLCRLRQRPLGFVRAPIENGGVDLRYSVRELLEKLTPEVGVALAERAIAAGRPLPWPDAGILVQPSLIALCERPLVTVAVCTNGRENSIRACLDSLAAVDYRPVDVLVVDYGGDAATERLVSEYSDVRYVHESQPGLDPARRRAIQECRGDILAFTDDGAVVDRHWLSVIVRAFLADPEVMAVKGLVIPSEIEPQGQLLLEPFRHPAGGFRRRWSRTRIDETAVGNSSNAAFWRSSLDGGRVPTELHTSVYEPSAIVRTTRIRCRAMRPQAVSTHRGTTITRQIDLADLVRPIADATGHDRLQVTVSWEGAPLGEVVIEHHGAVVSTAWLMDVIAQQLTVPLLDATTGLGETVLWSTVTSTLAHALMPAIEVSSREPRRPLSAAA